MAEGHARALLHDQPQAQRLLDRIHRFQFPAAAGGSQGALIADAAAHRERGQHLHGLFAHLRQPGGQDLPDAGAEDVDPAGPHGFGRAIIYGLDRMRGDAAVALAADESDAARDVVRYWKLLNDG